MPDAPSLDALLQGFLLYAVLPAWVFFGFMDYVCHRHSRIEETTGIKESLMHAVMGIQVGLPIALGLFLEINVLIMLITLVVLATHEWVAHVDVKTAYEIRKISIWEIHAHSFLEVIPFGIFGLVVLLKWPDFIKLVTFDWGGSLGLALKAHPIDSGFIVSYAVLMLLGGILPYGEELLRCLRAEARR